MIILLFGFGSNFAKAQVASHACTTGQLSPAPFAASEPAFLPATPDSAPLTSNHTTETSRESFGASFRLAAEDWTRLPVGRASLAPYVAGEPGDGSSGINLASFAQQQQGGGASAATAEEDNGTNPAKNTTTFIASNEYYTLEGNNRINTTYARLKFPIHKGRGAMLFEVPLVNYDFRASNPNLPQIGGLGDIKFQLSYNTWTSPTKRLTLINFMEFYVPSADNAIVAQSNSNINSLTAFNLGTGKYVLGPGLGLVYSMSPQLIFAPLYFYEASVAGATNREDIRRGKWRIFAMYATPSGWYTLPELQIVTNYLNSNNDVYFAPEVGYSKTGATLYVKPGIGANPDVGDRQWGIEFGGRFQF